MKIAAMQTPEGTQLVVQRADGWQPVDAPPGTDLADVLRAFEPQALAQLLEAHSDRRLDGPLAAPLRPRKIVAIGLNYLDHVEESGVEPPSSPLVFAKFPSAVVGPDAPVLLNPAVAERVDWEGELAVVIGRRLRHADRATAMAGVFGYTIANDVSARDVQFGDVQWIRGKNLDTFCPLGPAIVTADEIPDPQALRVTTTVNGEVVQDAPTAKMIFGVAELLSFCSHSFTLEPGDVLLSGTPWGCGEFMEPRRSLRGGDVMEVRVDPIGVLRNPVRD